MELKIDDSEILSDTEQMIDNNKLGILIMSSADDAIGVGSLLQFTFDQITLLEHNEEGWVVHTKPEPLTAFDILIV